MLCSSGVAARLQQRPPVKIGGFALKKKQSVTIVARKIFEDGLIG